MSGFLMKWRHLCRAHFLVLEKFADDINFHESEYPKFHLHSRRVFKRPYAEHRTIVCVNIILITSYAGLGDLEGVS